MSKIITIYYSIDDPFPPYRVDVAELFGNELCQKGIDIVWYMHRSKPGKACSDVFNGQTVFLPKMIYERSFLSKLLNKFFFYFFDVFYFFGIFRKKIDVVQVRDKYFAALVGLFVARVKGAKFVYWCSYPFPEHYLDRSASSSGVKKIYSKIHGLVGRFILYKFVIPRSDHSFVQSERMAADIAAFGVPSCRMTPVPMGVSTSMLEWAERRQFTIRRNEISYIGSLAAVRGIPLLIGAFNEVLKSNPHAHLTLVGEGDFPFERSGLEDLVKQLNITESVSFTGFVPMEQAWEIAARSAVCISPIFPNRVLAPASPTKLVEYMALGRPVICNEHPEQSAVIRDSGAGMCVPWSESEFAHAMTWMLQHPDEAERMGAKGPEWVRENRTYATISSQVMRKYQDLIEVAR